MKYFIIQTLDSLYIKQSNDYLSRVLFNMKQRWFASKLLKDNRSLNVSVVTIISTP